MKTISLLAAVLTLLMSDALAADVAMHDKGSSVVLDNSVVNVEISKVNGNVLALNYGKDNLFAEPGYLDWQTGKANHIGAGQFELKTDPVRNGGEMAEVVITQKWPGSGENAYDIALHHVLRRGDSGFYSYAVFSHPASYPAAGFGQSRMVLRLKDSIFDMINVDEQRRRLMPPNGTPGEVLGPKESTRFTEGPFTGFITDKYHFSADAGNHFAYGWTSTKQNIGCWIVKGSNEEHNGGPTKQRNTVHFPRMLLYILSCGHYGAAGVEIAANEPWEKMYGPWMVYVNSGANSDALWADVNKKAAIEHAAWPYTWVKDADYPLAKDRGTVRGRLQLTDAQNPAITAENAWVGLSAAQPDWQQESKGYQFWVKAGKGGDFVLPNVRPGNYTLYAFADGVFDQYRHDSVTVKAGPPLDLGALDWKAIHFGKQQWQIGVPDRTAKEFRHGDDYKQWGLWLKYPQEFPDGVNFTIGKSVEKTDWNYSQMTVAKDGAFVGTTWNVLFKLGQTPPPGQAALRFAFAGGQNARLRVMVNGQPAGTSARIGTDNAMVRAGIHGQYSQWDLRFDSALLKAGDNTIALVQTEGGSMQKNVMYDCVRLETPF